MRLFRRVVRFLAARVPGRVPYVGVRPRAHAPSRDFFLALRASFTPETPIEIFSPHHVCGEGLDVLPALLTVEHERNHRVWGKLSAQRLTRSLSYLAPLVAGEERVLSIVHRGTAVVIRLFVSFFKACQVRVRTTMTRRRLRQVEVNLTVLLPQPGKEIWDETMCPVLYPVHYPVLSSRHLCCHLVTSRLLAYLRTATFV